MLSCESQRKNNMNKYFLYSHLQKTFQSIRKETREHIYLSFHRAYMLAFFLLIVLGVLYVWTLNASANSGYQMTSVEAIRREKLQEKHFLRAQIAEQESRAELDKNDDRTLEIRPENISYITLE